MRAAGIIVTAALLGVWPAAAADLDRVDPAAREAAVAPVVGAAHGYGYGYGAYGYRAPPPVVVAPRAYVLVAPRRGPPPLRYAPPPVYPVPPPLIAAVPIVGAYLVPPPYGPPPATVLDAYDHRFDYNQ